MAITQYYTATSLDGYIADADNSLGLAALSRARRGTVRSNYADFIANVGAMAMGSTTYEWVIAHEFADKDPAEWKWPYDLPCWVFTHRQLPVFEGAAIEFVSGDVARRHVAMAECSG